MIRESAPTHFDEIDKKNLMVTVEPGVYCPGVGGVRIEDDVLVTAGGHKRLSTLPRRLNRMMLQ